MVDVNCSHAMEDNSWSLLQDHLDKYIEILDTLNNTIEELNEKTLPLIMQQLDVLAQFFGSENVQTCGDEDEGENEGVYVSLEPEPEKGKYTNPETRVVLEVQKKDDGGATMEGRILDDFVIKGSILLRMKEDKRDIDQELEFGQNFLDIRNYNKAIHHFSMVIFIGPFTEWICYILNNRGKIHRACERYKEAIEGSEEMIALNIELDDNDLSKPEITVQVFVHQCRNKVFDHLSSSILLFSKLMGDHIKSEMHNCVIEVRVNSIKKRDKVYIGCGARFRGDRPYVTLKLLQRVMKQNYLVLECLAEQTLADVQCQWLQFANFRVDAFIVTFGHWKF